MVALIDCPPLFMAAEDEGASAPASTSYSGLCPDMDTSDCYNRSSSHAQRPVEARLCHLSHQVRPAVEVDSACSALQTCVWCFSRPDLTESSMHTRREGVMKEVQAIVAAHSAEMRVRAGCSPLSSAWSYVCPAIFLPMMVLCGGAPSLLRLDAALRRTLAVHR